MTESKMMRCLPLLLAVLICTALAPLAKADLYSLYQCNPGVGGLCAAATGPYGTVDVTWFDQPTGVIQFDVTAASGFGFFGRFGFNVSPSTSVNITDVAPGTWTGSGNPVADGNINLDGFGHFDFELTGPGGSSSVSSLSFRVARDTGQFASLSEIEVLSDGGDSGASIFVVHVAALGDTCRTPDACTGWAGTNQDGFINQVPEPGTMTMMGAGLAAIGLLLRRRIRREA